MAWHHDDCWEESGACAACGFREPTEPWATPWGERLGLAFGAAALSYVVGLFILEGLGR